MSKKINKRALIIITVVVAVIAIVGGSLAWFVTNTSLSQSLSISGFDVTADVYFADGSKKISASDYKDSDGLYLLSLSENDANYIGNLRVNVGHAGAKACIRVKMNYEWTVPGGAVAQHDVCVPYTFGGEWFDNRNTDYCVYYRGADNTGKASFSTCELITGFDKASFDTTGFVDGVSVRVLVQVDGVQVNRYPQLWNIDTLPWK